MDALDELVQAGIVKVVQTIDADWYDEFEFRIAKTETPCQKG